MLSQDLVLGNNYLAQQLAHQVALAAAAVASSNSHSSSTTTTATHQQQSQLLQHHHHHQQQQHNQLQQHQLGNSHSSSNTSQAIHQALAASNANTNFSSNNNNNNNGHETSDGQAQWNQYHQAIIAALMASSANGTSTTTSSGNIGANNHELSNNGQLQWSQYQQAIAAAIMSSSNNINNSSSSTGNNLDLEQLQNYLTNRQQPSHLSSFSQLNPDFSIDLSLNNNYHHHHHNSNSDVHLLSKPKAASSSHVGRSNSNNVSHTTNTATTLKPNGCRLKPGRSQQNSLQPISAHQKQNNKFASISHNSSASGGSIASSAKNSNNNNNTIGNSSAILSPNSSSSNACWRFLESLYAMNDKPEDEAIELIAQKINSTSVDVTDWFQSRREAERSILYNSLSSNASNNNCVSPFGSIFDGEPNNISPTTDSPVSLAATTYKPQPPAIPSSSLLAKLNAVTSRPSSQHVNHLLDQKMVDLLEAFYAINDNPEPAAIEMISKRINSTVEIIGDWFDEKRIKTNPHAGPRSPPAKKREGGRVVTFSEYQRSLLEAIFDENNYLHPQEYEELSNLIQVPSRNIKIWFKNRRSKQRLSGRITTP